MNPKKAASKKAPAKPQPREESPAKLENIMADGQRIGIRFRWNPALCPRVVRAHNPRRTAANPATGAK